MANDHIYGGQICQSICKFGSMTMSIVVCGEEADRFLVVSILTTSSILCDFVNEELIDLNLLIDRDVGCSLGVVLNPLSFTPVYIHPFLDANETIRELPRLQEHNVVESWSQHRINNEPL